MPMYALEIARRPETNVATPPASHRDGAPYMPFDAPHGVRYDDLESIGGDWETLR
jgi:hypothetical protein